MPPFRLPGVDPEVLVLIGVVGAVLGGVSAMGAYVLNKWADETGRRDVFLPPIEPLTRQEIRP